MPQLRCKLCRVKIESDDELLTHNRQNHEWCQLRQKHVDDLQDHQDEVHNWPCPLCDGHHSMHEDLWCHLAENHSNRKIECEHCVLTSSHAGSNSLGENQVNPRAWQREHGPYWSCRKCQQTFRTQVTRLSSQMRQVSGIEPS